MKTLLGSVGLCLLALSLAAQTPVEVHGKLSTSGGNVVDECGRKTQLTGVSLTAHHWDGEWWNADVVQWLSDDWKIDLLRAPLGVANYGVENFAPYNDEGDEYIGNPGGSEDMMRVVVDAAIDAGVYVIIDFHSHNNFKDRAKTFFGKMAEEYGGTPNVIYEIWNEPIRDGLSKEDAEVQAGWDEIQEYAREVIAVIREKDPDNLIVVPTPVFDQFPDIVARDPITSDADGNALVNVAYTVHFYAGGGGADFNAGIRSRAQTAIDEGYPIFVTECGRVGFDYGPDNTLDSDEWDRWQAWMDANSVSYAKWHITDKDERTAMLLPSASRSGGWANSDLSEEGKWDRNHFRGRADDTPSRCNGGSGGGGGGGGGDLGYRDVFTDGFGSGWGNWSWGGSADAGDGLAIIGQKSFRYSFNGAGGAVSFAHGNGGHDASNMLRVEFWARTYSGSANIDVNAAHNNGQASGDRSPKRRITLDDTYRKFTFTKAELGNYGWYSRFFLHNASGAGQTVYVDDFKIVYDSPSRLHLDRSTLSDAPAGQPALNIFPSPTRGATTLTVALERPIPAAQIVVLDRVGRVVGRQAAPLTAGDNRVDVYATAGLASGIYAVRVLDDSGRYVGRGGRVAVE